MALSVVRRRAAPPSLRYERGTLTLAVVALGTTGLVIGREIARIWRRGSAPLPREADRVLEAAATAARETGEVAVAGYQRSPTREGAALNLLASFTLTFGMARISSTIIRRRGTFGPFRDLFLGRRHIHHFVPGLVLAFAAGGGSILSRDERIDPWLAIPFGAGLGLTLDESALLLRLEDVYWSEEGVLSVQIGLTTMALIAGALLARRVFRRGEADVLQTEGAAS